MKLERVLELLGEMKKNCLSGMVYDDPLRNEKAMALNHAIFWLSHCGGDYAWQEADRIGEDEE